MFATVHDTNCSIPFSFTFTWVNLAALHVQLTVTLVVAIFEVVIEISALVIVHILLLLLTINSKLKLKSDDKEFLGSVDKFTLNNQFDKLLYNIVQSLFGLQWVKISDAFQFKINDVVTQNILSLLQ